MFGLTNILKENDKKKYMYIGYGIAFDEKNKTSFGSDFARNVIIFVVDNSSSS